MSISAQRFTTKARTWLLIFGLTALLIGIGALIGGALESDQAFRVVAERVAGV
jgi:hypothetical protein